MSRDILSNFDFLAKLLYLISSVTVFHFCIPVFCIELPEGYTIIPELDEEQQVAPESCESTNSDSAQPPAGVEAPVVEMPPEIPAAAVIPETLLGEW